MPIWCMHNSGWPKSIRQIGFGIFHYDDVIMNTMASQITSRTIVYSTVYSGADQRKHESSVSLTFVRGIHRGPVNSPHKWPVARKMFPFDDVILTTCVFRCHISISNTWSWTQRHFDYYRKIFQLLFPYSTAVPYGHEWALFPEPASERIIWIIYLITTFCRKDLL